MFSCYHVVMFSCFPVLFVFVLSCCPDLCVQLCLQNMSTQTSFILLCSQSLIRVWLYVFKTYQNKGVAFVCFQRLIPVCLYVFKHKQTSLGFASNRAPCLALCLGSVCRVLLVAC